MLLTSHSFKPIFKIDFWISPLYPDDFHLTLCVPEFLVSIIPEKFCRSKLLHFILLEGNMSLGIIFPC